MHQAGVKLHRDHGDGCCWQLPVKGQQWAKEFKSWESKVPPPKLPPQEIRP